MAIAPRSSAFLFGPYLGFYNITRPVGPGASNQNLDVRIVQFFLEGLYRRVGEVFTRPTGHGPLAETGAYDRATNAYLLDFQYQIRLRHLYCTTLGGPINPVPASLWADNSFSSDLQKYTLFVLQHLYYTEAGPPHPSYDPSFSSNSSKILRAQLRLDPAGRILSEQDALRCAPGPLPDTTGNSFAL